MPPAHPRTHLHNRDVVYRGYRRDDGLWDIEGELRDTKEQVFEIAGEDVWQPGDAIHGMAIRVTIDNTLTVRDIAVAMDHVPHGECPPAQASMHMMIGSTMGPGWRKAIDRNLGGIRGCTHLRELLFNMATAAYQTLPEDAFPMAEGVPPPHLGKCMAWDFNGPVVRRHYPMFFQRDPREQTQPVADALRHV